MTIRCNAYPTEAAARRAVEALRAKGVPERDIRLLTGRELGDVRREPVGGFAGPRGPGDPVGTYGGVVLRRQGAGSFVGDPDRQRQGSFADTDRVVIVTYKHGAERARVTGLRGVRRLLSRAALDDDALDRAVDDLHRGRALVLVESQGIAAARPRAVIPSTADHAREQR